MTDKQKNARIVPPPPIQRESDREHERMWGFADSGFEVKGGSISFNSDRYAGKGELLPDFPPFVERAIGVAFDPNDVHELVEPVVPDLISCDDLMSDLRDALGETGISVEPCVRLRHGHGHHLEEIYQVLFESLSRVPDVVVFPKDDKEVRFVLDLAAKHAALVIPYGGGTCVSMALSCVDESRAIISLDMARMNRIEWIDPVSKTACIQGGAVGRVIEEQLKEYGFTLGHEPDSIEFSTMGGWVATAASGMKKNRYGNIEDVVLDVTVVTRQGVVHQTHIAPRNSHGLDLTRLAIGSEGMLGVITRVVAKLHSLPEVQRYGSLVFPSWQHGLAFMEEISTWQTAPASVRLVDNMQFQFGRALKPSHTPAIVSAIQKLVVTQLHGIDVEKMVACTLVYEGENDEQADLQRRVVRAAKKHGGFGAGKAAGKDGYHLTFGIAYIRDFLLQYWTLGDSFETSVPWGQVDFVIDAVKASVQKSHEKHGLCGRAFVTARVSQVYPTGCCVYFYIGFHYKGVNDPIAVFRDMEHDARVAILDAGGALSHHHGIGKVRAPYLDRVKSREALKWAEQTQAALDPDGIFASGNQGITPRTN